MTPTPRPVARRLAEAGPDGVFEDVETTSLESRLGIDHVDGVPPLEKVPITPMALVEELHISTVQPLHAARKIRLRGLDDQVVVIGQQAERATGPFVANDDGAQEVRNVLSVDVVDVDGAVVRPTPCDVIDADLGEVFARSSRHGSKVDEHRRLR